MALHTARQFEDGDFGSSADADGNDGGSDSAVDVELSTGFFVPSADVGRLQSAEGEAAAEELQRQLAAVRVAGQLQVGAESRRPIEVAGVVTQQNVDGSRHYQTLDGFSVRLAVIDANQIKRVAAQLDGRPLLTQYVNPFAGEQPGGGVFG